MVFSELDVFQDLFAKFYELIWPGNIDAVKNLKILKRHKSKNNPTETGRK